MKLTEKREKIVLCSRFQPDHPNEPIGDIDYWVEVFNDFNLIMVLSRLWVLPMKLSRLSGWKDQWNPLECHNSPLHESNNVVPWSFGGGFNSTTNSQKGTSVSRRENEETTGHILSTTTLCNVATLEGVSQGWSCLLFGLKSMVPFWCCVVTS